MILVVLEKKIPEQKVKHTGAKYAVTTSGGRQRHNASTRESLSSANVLQQAAARTINILECCYDYRYVLLLPLYDTYRVCESYVVSYGYIPLSGNIKNIPILLWIPNTHYISVQKLYMINTAGPLVSLQIRNGTHVTRTGKGPCRREY